MGTYYEPKNKKGIAMNTGLFSQVWGNIGCVFLKYFIGIKGFRLVARLYAIPIPKLPPIDVVTIASIQGSSKKNPPRNIHCK